MGVGESYETLGERIRRGWRRGWNEIRGEDRERWMTLCISPMSMGKTHSGWVKISLDR